MFFFDPFGGLANTANKIIADAWTTVMVGIWNAGLWVLQVVFKAKELRRVAEPLITLAKVDSVANRRLAFDRTRSKAIVGKLFNDLGKRYATRQGGYLRILKCGFRAGDNAPMAYVELVDRQVAGEAVEAAE